MVKLVALVLRNHQHVIVSAAENEEADAGVDNLFLPLSYSLYKIC